MNNVIRRNIMWYLIRVFALCLCSLKGRYAYMELSRSGEAIVKPSVFIIPFTCTGYMKKYIISKKNTLFLSLVI